MGWDVNVHVNLRQQLMLRTRGVGGVGWGGMLSFMEDTGRGPQSCARLAAAVKKQKKNWSHNVSHVSGDDDTDDDDDDDADDDEEMMMMNMTQMKLVNSATKFRHGMDKFYQPNSGLRSSRSLDEAIYTTVILSSIPSSIGFSEIFQC